MSKVRLSVVTDPYLDGLGVKPGAWYPFKSMRHGGYVDLPNRCIFVLVKQPCNHLLRNEQKSWEYSEDE